MDFGINALHRLHGLNDDGGCWEAMSGRRSKVTKVPRRRYLPASLISGDVSFDATIRAVTKEPFSQRTSPNPTKAVRIMNSWKPPSS